MCHPAPLTPYANRYITILNTCARTPLSVSVIILCDFHLIRSSNSLCYRHLLRNSCLMSLKLHYDFLFLSLHL